MFKLTKLITLAPDTNDRDRNAIAVTLKDALHAPHVAGGLFEPALAGGVNGGDFIWHAQFGDERAYKDDACHPVWQHAEDALKTRPVTHVDSIAYQQQSLGIREAGSKQGIYRALLVSLRPDIASQKVRQFENEMRDMAGYIAAIRNWGFSRATESSGCRHWDYVWEQEFADVDALAGPYMKHPYHFARIDRWFDPESQDWILDTSLCHSFCAFTESVLAPSSTSQLKSQK